MASPQPMGAERDGAAGAGGGALSEPGAEVAAGGARGEVRGWPAAAAGASGGAAPPRRGARQAAGRGRRCRLSRRRRDEAGRPAAGRALPPRPGAERQVYLAARPSPWRPGCRPRRHR